MKTGPHAVPRASSFPPSRQGGSVPPSASSGRCLSATTVPNPAILTGSLSIFHYCQLPKSRRSLTDCSHCPGPRATVTTQTAHVPTPHTPAHHTGSNILSAAPRGRRKLAWTSEGTVPAPLAKKPKKSRQEAEPKEKENGAPRFQGPSLSTFQAAGPGWASQESLQEGDAREGDPTHRVPERLCPNKPGQPLRQLVIP